VPNRSWMRHQPVHLFIGMNALSPAPFWMMFHVLGKSLASAEIFGCIVCGVAINMVNNLTGPERSPELGFHHHAMLVDPPVFVCQMMPPLLESDVSTRKASPLIAQAPWIRSLPLCLALLASACKRRLVLLQYHFRAINTLNHCPDLSCHIPEYATACHPMEEQ